MTAIAPLVPPLARLVRGPGRTPAPWLLLAVAVLMGYLALLSGLPLWPGAAVATAQTDPINMGGAQPPPSANQAQAMLVTVDKVPAPVTLTYTVFANKFPFRLSGELQWQHSAASYQSRLTISAFGLDRRQSSRGTIGPAGLQPDRFSDKYRSEVAATFNYALGKVSFSASTPDLTLMPGAQDRLSVLVQLGAMLASQPARFSPGTTLSIQTVGAQAGELWLFTVEGKERLDLPGGTLDSVKLVRNPREQVDQRLEVWLAPALDHLPARIRITETNGDTIDQQWRSTQPAEPLN